MHKECVRLALLGRPARHAAAAFGLPARAAGTWIIATDARHDLYGRARVGRIARAGARPDSEQLRFQSGHHMRRMLTWASSLDRAALAADGHRLVEFTAVRREVESRTRRAQQRRTSLANPAEEWLSGVAAAGKLAILGVRLTSLDDLRVLHGYVLEPALRSATAVAVECEQRLTRLEPVQFVDPEFGLPVHAGAGARRGDAPVPRPRRAVARTTRCRSGGRGC